MADTWQVMTKKILLKTPYGEVWQDDVMLPNGKVAPYYITRKKSFSIAIPVYEGKTMLVKQYRPAVKNSSWEFPMGYIENATPVEMARDELQQETGLIAKKLIELGTWLVAPGQSNQVAHAYLAQDITFGEQKLDENEFIERKEVPLTEIGAMIENGHIKDASSIVSYYFLRQYTEKKGITL